MKIILFILLYSISLFSSIGTVMATKGDISIIRDDTTIKAKAGIDILKHDKIHTAKKSRVQIMLKDETIVTVGAKSDFSFDDYVFDGKNSKVAMRSSRGFFRSVTGKIGKLAPQRFKVKTASATIGIRGTDFWGITGGDEEKFVCNSGQITVEYDGIEHEVSAGNFIQVSKNGIKEGSVSNPNQKNETIKKSSKKDTTSKKDAQTAPAPQTATEAIEITETQIDIPTESISDIIQVFETTEPFDVTLGSEDRAEEY